MWTPSRVLAHAVVGRRRGRRRRGARHREVQPRPVVARRSAYSARSARSTASRTARRRTPPGSVPPISSASAQAQADEQGGHVGRVRVGHDPTPLLAAAPAVAFIPHAELIAIPGRDQFSVAADPHTHLGGRRPPNHAHLTGRRVHPTLRNRHPLRLPRSSNKDHLVNPAGLRHAPSPKTPAHRRVRSWPTHLALPAGSATDRRYGARSDQGAVSQNARAFSKVGASPWCRTGRPLATG